MSLLQSWLKEGVEHNFLKEEFEALLDKILNFKHFNKLKQFMLKLIRNAFWVSGCLLVYRAFFGECLLTS